MHTGSLPDFHRMPALFKGLIQKTSGYIVPLASPSFPLLLSLLNGTERGRGLEKEAKGIKSYATESLGNTHLRETTP